ncbi:glycosyltransferase [Sphingomonas sp.]|uniref:glycosyltransferase n=1 Tax=Sphingomonas sp. TaxID=28214 RepID=UPI0038AC8367
MITASPIYCDITELVSNPVRTGIQRVAREVIRNWNGSRRLRLCRFDPKLGLVELPEAVSYYLTEPDEATRSASTAAIRERLSELIVSHKGNVVRQDCTIFIPEVFFDESRCRHYLWLLSQNPEKIYALFYDFIPWLYPDLIGVQRSHPLMWYLRVAQHVENAAFISDATRRDWATRILRDEQRSGTVLPLGADGLRVSRQTFNKKKRNFVVLGSIDGRKNQLSILRAFKKLWADDLSVELTLVGSVFAAEQAIRAELEECAQCPHFRHVENATDTEIGEILSSARATIYASTTEGYGLPPVESLYAGIPSIVSRRVPSVAGLSGGVRFLDEATPDEIANEVRALLRDGEAEKAWKEASKLSLPTWQQFGSATADWIGNQ